MGTEPSVLLVGPYEGDRIGSIERFVRCLGRELSDTRFRVIAPKRRLARFVPEHSAAEKWLGYADKFLLFPKALRRVSAGADVIHFSDQSCAIYSRTSARATQLLTCTDLLAIRSARGELSEHRTRWSGRRLQRLIARGIERCDHVACISSATERDLRRCTNVRSSSVIPMGLHTSFQRTTAERSAEVLRRFAPEGPFILHVGGNQWYKNRPGVLEIYQALARLGPNVPHVLLAGEPPAVELTREIIARGLAGKVFSAAGCSDADLAALYSGAELLLFPSLHEGFGWPIIEAQACGCPVVTSNREPMAEIAGSAAELINPQDPAGAAMAVARVISESQEERARRRDAGLRNAKFYSTEKMIQAYRELYEGLSPRSALPEAALA